MLWISGLNESLLESQIYNLGRLGRILFGDTEAIAQRSILHAISAQKLQHRVLVAGSYALVGGHLREFPWSIEDRLERVFTGSEKRCGELEQLRLSDNLIKTAPLFFTKPHAPHQ